MARQGLRPLRRWTALSAALLVALGPTLALSAPPAPASAAYEQHMAAGKKLIEEESWAAAVAELEAAYAAEPRAAPLIQIATCQVALQKWPQAIAALEKALHDHAATLDEAEKKAAEKDLADLRAQIGTVQVVIWPANATLRVDGEDQPAAGPQRVITLGPGPHRLEAKLEGWLPAAQTITIEGGDTQAVKLGLARTIEAREGGAARGLYALAAFTPFVPLPPSDFSGTALGFSGGVRLGYRFASLFGAELAAEYAHAGASGQGQPSFADLPSGTVPISYSLSSFRVGVGARLMTTGQRLRFVQVLGGGVAYDSIHWTPGAGGIPRQGASGVDGFGISETGLEVDVAGVLIGLAVQQIVGSHGALDFAQHDKFSADTYGGPQYSIGLGLRGGYRLW